MNPAEDYYRGLGKTFEDTTYSVEVWNPKAGVWVRSLHTEDWDHAYARYNFHVGDRKLVRVVRRVQTTVHDLEMHTGDDVRVDHPEHARRALDTTLW